MKRKRKRLICWLLVGAGLLPATLGWCRGAEASLADCLDATCRIHAPDGSTGTGCVFEISQGAVFVLTNRHVVGTADVVRCVFWQHGHQSTPIAAQVLARSDQVDVALVTVCAASFDGRLPRVIPIAPRGTRLAPGETVTSVGCASGAWATGWKGHVLGYDGTSVCFTPPPADGRSGSALFDADGRRIVGLIWGRLERGEGEGYAITVENLYRALNFEQTAAGWVHAPLRLLTVADSAQCGPYGCTPQAYILPYRNYQQQRQQQRERQFDQLDRRLDLRSQVWPTLPPQIQGKVQVQTEIEKQPATETAPQEVTKRASGLGVALTLAAALAVGVFLFYVVGRQ
jgi:hypothetical protein